MEKVPTKTIFYIFFAIDTWHFRFPSMRPFRFYAHNFYLNHAWPPTTTTTSFWTLFEHYSYRQSDDADFGSPRTVLNLLDTVSARPERRRPSAARPRLRDANAGRSVPGGSDRPNRRTSPGPGVHTNSTPPWNAVAACSISSAHDHPETVGRDTVFFFSITFGNARKRRKGVHMGAHARARVCVREGRRVASKNMSPVETLHTFIACLQFSYGLHKGTYPDNFWLIISSPFFALIIFISPLNNT